MSRAEGRVAGFLRERLPVDRARLQELTNEPVPHHLKHWWFCLGGTPAYLFVVMIVTGILLAFYYEAAPERAWESVRSITDEVAFGWFLHSIHHWAATLMVAAVILHQMRVFFTGAYRRPRELNWLIGMGLLVCTLIAGFTGQPRLRAALLLGRDRRREPDRQRASDRRRPETLPPGG